jgi:hypothetical protein
MLWITKADETRLGARKVRTPQHTPSPKSRVSSFFSLVSFDNNRFHRTSVAASNLFYADLKLSGPPMIEREGGKMKRCSNYGPNGIFFN